MIHIFDFVGKLNMEVKEEMFNDHINVLFFMTLTEDKKMFFMCFFPCIVYWNLNYNLNRKKLYFDYSHLHVS